MAFAEMKFTGIIGGAVAIVWLPRKSEVFGPPLKIKEQFEISKRQQATDENTWKLFRVTCCLFEIDDLVEAKEKIKKADYTSELSTEVEGREMSSILSDFLTDESKDKSFQVLSHAPLITMWFI